MDPKAEDDDVIWEIANISEKFAICQRIAFLAFKKCTSRNKAEKNTNLFLKIVK
jgi:hypothetical protein